MSEKEKWLGNVPLLVQEAHHSRPHDFNVFILILISIVDLTSLRDFPIIVISTNWQYIPKPSLSLVLLEVIEALLAEGQDEAFSFRVLSF